MNKNESIDKIRNRYIDRTPDTYDELRTLDRTVSRPAKIFAYLFGSLSALVLGCGMSLIMTDLAQTVSLSNALPIGIVIGSIGLVGAAVNYPIYRTILRARRKRYAARICEIADKAQRENVPGETKISPNA